MPSVIAEIRGKSTNVNKITKDLDGVGKSTERLGRNQTRLAQASASAGRSFAAQSAGLGGVVGVYAAAAANVFAITAAFTALNRAAQFATIIQGTEQLANAVGSSANEVISSLKDITQGQLSIVEAATQANLALSAGFNVDQIEELGEVALKSSRALGRNLTDAFQRITRGAIKLEPELLDEIGIFTRIEPAVEAYAASINKSASQLTQFERRQAFVNQVIKDGQAAFQDIEDSGKSTQEVFESLVANFSDLAIIATKFLADALVPLAAFLDQNLGNRIVLLGAVGTLVFGRLRESLGQLATVGLTALGTRLEGLGESLRSRKVDVEALAAAQAKASAGFVGQGALAGGAAGRSEGAALKRELQAGPLTTKQALNIQERIPALKQREVALQDELKEKIKESKVERQKGLDLIDKSKKRTDALNQTQTLVNAQLQAGGKGALFVAKGLNVAAVAANALAVGLNRAFLFLQIIVGVFTTLQFLGSALFDVDLFQKAKDLISSIGKEARQVEAGFIGLANSVEEASGRIDTLLQGVDKFSREAVLKKAADLAGKSMMSLQQAARQAQIEIKRLEGGTTVSQVFGFTDDREALAAIEERKLKLQAINLLLSDQGEQLSNIARVSSIIAEKSGFSDTKVVTEQINRGFISIKDSALEVAGVNFPNIEDLSEGAIKAAQKLADGQMKADDLQKSLEKGTINASRASKDAITVISQLEASQAAANKELAKMDESDIGFQALTESVAAAGREIEKFKNGLQETVNNVVALENIGKVLQKQLGGDFKFLDESMITGVISAETGKIARDEAEQNKFRTDNLMLLMDQLKNAEQLGLTQSEINELQTIESKLRKGSEASLLKAVQITQKQIKENEKALKQEESKLQISRLQNDLLRMQVQAQADNRAEKDALDIAKNRLAIRREEFNLTKEIEKNALRELKHQMDLNTIFRERANLQSQLKEAGFAQADAAADAASATKVAALENRKAAIEQQTLTTRDQIVRMEIDIIRFKAQEDKARLDREIAANERKRVFDLEAIDRREDALVDEFEFNSAKIRSEMEIMKIERQLASEQNKLRLQELEAQENALKRTGQQLPLQKEIADAQSKAAFEARKFALDEIERRAQLQAEKIKSDAAFLSRYTELLKQEAANRGQAFMAGENTDFESAANVSVGNIGTILDQINQQRINNMSQFGQDLNRNELQNQLAVSGNREAIDNLQRQQGLTEAVGILQERIAAKQRGASQAELDRLNEILVEKVTNLGLERDLVNQNADTTLQKLQKEKEAVDANLKAQEEALAFQLTQQAKLKDLLEGVRDVISNELGTVTDKLFQNIADGKSLTEGLGETLRNSFENVRKKVLEETLIKPMQEKFTKGFNEMFGFEGAGGIDSAKVDASGALLVTMADGTLGPIEQGEKVTDTIKEKATDTFSSIKDGLSGLKEEGVSVFSELGGALKDTFGGIMSNIGGALGTSGAGGGGIFGKIFGGLSSVIGFGGQGTMTGAGGFTDGGMFSGIASGGFVPSSNLQRLAAGGMARDRVPALLEPGEFVMKRSAANSIGGPALNQMNATGKAGGNVVVNIENQGTPQDATASEPRFDGEKFVIDIVTRDLRNNGPIRKSLRGGGAG